MRFKCLSIISLPLRGILNTHDNVSVYFTIKKIKDLGVCLFDNYGHIKELPYVVTSCIQI